MIRLFQINPLAVRIVPSLTAKAVGRKALLEPTGVDVYKRQYVERGLPLPSASEQEDQKNPIENRRADPQHPDRPRHGEHLGPGAGDEPLWLCQDRHTVFSEFFQLPPKWGALIVLACRYKFKPARSTHIYLNLS